MPDNLTTKKATTVRIDPLVKERLLKLSTLLHQSLNKLTNDALNEFIDSRLQQVEQRLETSLKDVRAYRRSDPGFRRAIAEIAKAEVAITHDPLEGKIVTKLTRADKKALGIIE